MAGKDLFADDDAPVGRDLFALEDIAAGMTPDELRTAQTKNDEMGEYLRRKAMVNAAPAAPVGMEAGPSANMVGNPQRRDAAEFRRLYGGLTENERPGKVEGFARGYLQGGTFGFGDEAIAGIAAARDAIRGDASYGDAYNTRLSHEREKIGQFREDHPVLGYGSEIAGAIPSSLSGPLNLARGGSYALASGTGLGQGALYGFGAGEGGIENRAKDARTVGAVGGTIGAVGVPIAKGIGNVVGSRMVGSAAEKAGLSKPAYRTLNRGLQADDALTGGGAQRMAAAGEDAMLADAGSGAQRLLDTAIVESPPAARMATEAVEGRVDAAGRKLEGTLNRAMGEPGTSSSRALTIYGDKSNPLDTLYKRAYEQPIDWASPQGMEIESIVNSQVPHEAIDAANKLMRMEGHTSKQILFEVAEDGTVIYREMPDVRQLDYLTRGLRQLSESGEGAGALGGQTQMGAAYQNLVRGIRSRMKEIVPEYKAALNAAADAISSKKAREVGADVFNSKTTRADLAELIEDMGEAEMRKVVEGARMHIDDTLANVKATMTDANVDARETLSLLKNMSSRSSREKLGMILGDDVADGVARQFDEAMKAFELRGNVARNSATAVRQSTAQGVKDVVDGGAMNQLREGQILEAPKSIIAAIMGRSAARKQQISDEMYVEMVQALTGPRGAEARAMLEQITKANPLIDKRTGQVVDVISAMMGRNAPVSAQVNPTIQDALGAR